MHLLEPALALAYDPLANVRLHLAAAMPALKQAVALPDDVGLLERLNSGMSHLITDGDLDVCHAARKVRACCWQGREAHCSSGCRGLAGPAGHAYTFA